MAILTAKKALTLAIIALFSLGLASAGCWGYNNNCDNVDCYIPQYIEGFLPSAQGCRITPDSSFTFAFRNISCPQNIQNNINCLDFRTSITFYTGMSKGGSCSYCGGTLNCGNLAWSTIGESSDCDKSKTCYEHWGWDGAIWKFFACETRTNEAWSCGSAPDKVTCNALYITGSATKDYPGCSWTSLPGTAEYPDATEKYYSLTGANSGFKTTSQIPGCEYYPDLCKNGYELNPNTKNCVIPLCYVNETCSNTNAFGPGFFCNNTGEWNAECVVIPGFSFKADYTHTLNTVQYLFSLRNDENQQNTYLDISETLTDTPIYYDLISGQTFSINNRGYKAYFSLPLLTGGIYSLALYQAPTVSRLTYNIFPVCGNGLCETCESPDNCLSYPPESCLSCPKDCPFLSASDWVGFQRYKVDYDLKLELYPKDVAANPDNACKVKTRDANSLCNPLCLSHEFIDEMGCIFNRYSDAIPSSEFNNSAYNFTYSANPNLPKTLSLINVTFKNQDYKAYATVFDDFYGFNNSLCNHDCECVSNNCAECVGEGCGLTDNHCCAAGYSWSYADKKNKYCDNGRMRPEYREVFENYTLVGQTWMITSTLDENKNNGVPVEKYIKIYGSGPDPYCVYEESNEIIKPDEIGQCRKIREETLEVPVQDLRCIIHTHAWAKTHCTERKSFFDYFNPLEYKDGASSCAYGNHISGEQTVPEMLNTPYFNYFCATDNDLECASKFGVMELYKDSAPVLRSITYKEFCTTPSLVCGSTTLVTNSQTLSNIGGSILYNACPQDGLVYVDTQWYETAMEGFPEPTAMTVGYYCSLFGNDYARLLNHEAGSLFGLTSDKYAGAELINPNSYSTINNVTYYPKLFDLNIPLEVDTSTTGQWMFQEGDSLYVRASHTPVIDRDANEKLYHYLWNYETCKEIYPDLVTFNCNSYTAIKDEKKQPANPVLGTFDENYYYDLVGAVYNKDKKKLELDSSLTYKEATDRAASRNDWKDKLTLIDASVKSREFCDAMWNYYNTSVSKSVYNWLTNPGFAYSAGGSSFSIDAMKTIIKDSCLFWYPPFLEAYYNPNVPVETLGINIDSHLIYWGRVVQKKGVTLDFLSYKMIDSTFMRNQGAYSGLDFCSSGNGLINDFKKCSSIYPNALNDGKRNRIEPNKPNTPPDKITYNSCSCINATASTYFSGKTGCSP